MISGVGCSNPTCRNMKRFMAWLLANALVIQDEFPPRVLPFGDVHVHSGASVSSRPLLHVAAAQATHGIRE